MITLGNNKIAKMYLGATPVATSYLGSQQVYPNASLALSADLLAFAAAGGSQELTVAVEGGTDVGTLRSGGMECFISVRDRHRNTDAHD